MESVALLESYHDTDGAHANHRQQAVTQHRSDAVGVYALL
jgi:hypothetical protein